MGTSGARPYLDQNHIVNIAFDLINKNGIDNFSIRNLARELAVSPMTIYGYFPSKQAILDAVSTRLRDMYDTTAIPGESWGDTIRRTAMSIRQVDLKFPEIYVASSGWMPQCVDHTRRIYQLHRDQGMPLDVFQFLWSIMEAYLVGFIHQEIVQNKMNFDELEISDADQEWMMISQSAFNDQSFLQGIDTIIDGIKRTHPEESTWITPSNA